MPSIKQIPPPPSPPLLQTKLRCKRSTRPRARRTPKRPSRRFSTRRLCCAQVRNVLGDLNYTANFIWIVRFGFGLLSDVTIFRPNMSIFHVDSRILGLPAKCNVPFFHSSKYCGQAFKIFTIGMYEANQNEQSKRNLLYGQFGLPLL